MISLLFDSKDGDVGREIGGCEKVVAVEAAHDDRRKSSEGWVG